MKPESTKGKQAFLATGISDKRWAEKRYSPRPPSITTSYTNKPGKDTFTYIVEAFGKIGNLKGSSPRLREIVARPDQGNNPLFTFMKI